MKRSLGLTLLLGCMIIGVNPSANAETIPQMESATTTTVTYEIYSLQPLGRLHAPRQPLELTLSQSENLRLLKRLEMEVQQSGDSGWQLAVELADFTVRQPASGILAKFPAGYVSYTVSDIASNVAIEGISAGSGIFASGASQVVLQAAEGAGSGKTQADLSLNIDLPTLVEVAEVSGTANLAPGQQVGLLAGEYSATMRFTLMSSGI